MKMFVWEHIKGCVSSGRCRDKGTVVVVAESLERARSMILERIVAFEDCIDRHNGDGKYEHLPAMFGDEADEPVLKYKDELGEDILTYKPATDRLPRRGCEALTIEPHRVFDLAGNPPPSFRQYPDGGC